MKLSLGHIFASVAFVVCLSLVSFTWLSPEGSDDLPPVLVQKVIMQDQILARGEVRPATSALISSSISSDKAKIIWLPVEGTTINVGDEIARFDPAPFIESLQQKQLELDDAITQKSEIEKSIELTKQEFESDLLNYERELKIATFQADNIINGDIVLSMMEHQHDLEKIRQEQTLKSKELEDIKGIFKKGHVSQRDVDEIKYALDSLSKQEDMSKLKLNNFIKYTKPSKETEAQSLIDNASSQVENLKKLHALELGKLSMQLTQSNKKIERHRKQVSMVQEDLKNTAITSPLTGIAIYKTIRRNGILRKFQVGDSVWKGQSIIELPNTKDLVLSAMVRELDITKIKEGQNAQIKLDAIQDASFQGQVLSVSKVPSNDGSKVQKFNVNIRINNSADKIFIGMKGYAKIHLSEPTERLSVPISAVVFEGSKAYVRPYDNADKRIEIVPGIISTERVEVLEGLRENDLVAPGQEL